MMRAPIALLAVLLVILIAAAPAGAAERRRCPGDRNPYSATWFSIAHPGLGEYYLKGWGSFFDNAPPKKFWLGFIPLTAGRVTSR